MSTENTFTNEQDRVIIYDDLGEAVIHDALYKEDEGAHDLSEQFEIVTPKYGYWHADPDDSYYRGIEVMAVIRRIEDGRLFGFQYWTPIAKHAEIMIEPNGEENGLEFDVPDGFDWDNDYYPKPYVFLPVEPFTITGYKIAKAAL